MFAPLSWIFRKLARRYDRSAVCAIPDVWKEVRPSLGERLMRWIFGSPFRGEGASEVVFWRWVQRVALLALYLFFLWILYESFWAWGIFD